MKYLSVCSGIEAAASQFGLHFVPLAEEVTLVTLFPDVLANKTIPFAVGSACQPLAPADAPDAMAL